MVPCLSGAVDFRVWKPTANRLFSVRSAYQVCKPSTNDPAEEKAPPWGWCKLNVDGSRDRLTRVSSCGGVIRDSHGYWMMGFTKNLGMCSVLDAELWGIYEGLLCAWVLVMPKRSWEVRIVHIPRNSNKVADGLAKMA
ncbi:hypothetical protein V6N12_064054 [Hibiscus sabdariffa]|uniref:RNase H type-1 domain-containing protein n=1 Tax=Hibiscus sabdariffa TaxID=183260 RepID=A0ABR1ZGH4_9ROSI